MSDFSKLGQKRNITGYISASNSFYPVIIEHNKPAFVAHDYAHEISEGIIVNHKPIHLVSQVATANATEKDFTTIAGVDRISIPSATEVLKIVSTSSQDAPGGTGAFTIEVHGLDANGDLILEICEMNGLTPITTANTYWRINDSHVMSVGTNNSNAGEISIQSSGGTIFRNIQSGNNVDMNMHFTVPRSYNAFITGFGGGGLTGNTTTKGIIKLKSTTDPSDRLIQTGVDYIERIIEFKDSTTYSVYKVDVKVVALSVIRATIQRADGASGVSGNVEVDFYLDPDDLGL